MAHQEFLALLDPGLVESRDEQVQHRAGQRATADLQALSRAFGATDDLAVSVASSDVGLPGLISLNRGSQRNWCPTSVAQRACGYLSGSAVIPESVLEFATRWLGSASDAAEQDPGVRLGHVVGTLLRSMCAERPEILLGPARAAAWIEHVRSDVALHVAPAHLRDVTVRHPERTDAFPYLHEGLFEELGVPLPDLGLVADPDLGGAGMAVAFRGIAGNPCVGLPPDRVLVNDTVDRLALMGVEEAVATINPVTSKPGAIVPAQHASQLQDWGLTTWDDLEYLVLVAAGSLRRHADWLVDPQVTEQLLARLSDDFPVLVRAARKAVGIDQITIVMRALLAEGVPIRDLRTILESLVEHSLLDVETEPIAFVRTALAGTIAGGLARQSRTVVVYLLDPRFETLVAESSDGFPGPAQSLLVEAVLDELGHLPPTAQTPALLVPDRLRLPVRRLLRGPVPELTVVSYGDIPSRFNVQPVARIAVPETDAVAG